MEPSPLARVDTDAVLHNAMVHTGHEDSKNPLYLEGNNRAEERDDQRRAVQDEAVVGIVVDTVADHYESKLLRGLEWLIDETALSFADTARSTIEAVVKNIHDEGLLNQAVRRENAIGACALLCEGVLPEGYRTHVLQGLIGGHTLPGQTNLHLPGVDVATDILKGKGGNEVALAIAANCQQGEQKAVDLGLRSQTDLDATLRLNPDFAHRFGTDLAFHMGVCAALWASIHSEPLDGVASPPHLAGWAAGINPG